MKDCKFGWIRNEETGVKRDITLKDLYATISNKNKLKILIELGIFVASGIVLFKKVFETGAKSYAYAEYNILNDLGLIDADREIVKDCVKVNE